MNTNWNSQNAAWMGVGIAIGVAIGVAMDSLAIGVAIGVVLGIAMMSIERSRGKQEDEPGDEGP